MSERWPEEAVAALAPDAASDKAARKLVTSSGWSGEGSQELTVWGSCAGSGKNPYVVQVDLSGPAYKCSCPSRKFPCKHALALLLRWADGTVPDAAPPHHVEAWVQSRAERAEKTAERAQTRATRQPAEKTVARRQERVEAGVEELERWLADLIGTGLATVRGQGAGSFDRMAARLVDAQAPGLAGWVRELPAVMHSGPDWAERLLADLALLHLLARAHGRLPELDAEDPELAASVREHVGYQVPKEAVTAQGTPVRDAWSVYAWEEATLDRLIRRTVHLQGRDTGRIARVLSFGPNHSTLDASLPVGTRVDADLVFYPGAAQNRALVAESRTATRGTLPPRSVTVAEAAAERARLLTRDPWLLASQHWVRAVLYRDDAGWSVADPDGGPALPLTVAAEPWTALAHTGGAAADHLLEWTRAGCRTLACVTPQGAMAL